MEKRSPRVKTTTTTTFMKLLPGAAAPVIFLNPPVSPVGDRRTDQNNNTIIKPHIPKVSIVPLEARKKFRNGSFDTREPTSPKVSCMGHINSKKKKKSSNKAKPEKPKKSKKKNPFSIYKIFQGPNICGKYGDTGDKQPGPRPAPCLSQMKRFTSGRDAFMNFDWRVLRAAAAVAPDNQFLEWKEEEEEEGGQVMKAITPFSEPIEPKKAIDLWKRRAVPPPPTLRLKKK